MLPRPDSPTAGGRPSPFLGGRLPVRAQPAAGADGGRVRLRGAVGGRVVKSHGVAFENRVRYVSPVPSTSQAAASAPGSAEGSAPAATA